MSIHQSVPSTVYERGFDALSYMEKSISHILYTLAEFSESMIQERENTKFSGEVTYAKDNIAAAVSNLSALQNILLNKASLYAMLIDGDSFRCDDAPYQVDLASDREHSLVLMKAVEKLKQAMHGTPHYWGRTDFLLRRMGQYFLEKKYILGVESRYVHPPAPPWLSKHITSSTRNQSK